MINYHGFSSWNTLRLLLCYGPILLPLSFYFIFWLLSLLWFDAVPAEEHVSYPAQDPSFQPALFPSVNTLPIARGVKRWGFYPTCLKRLSEPIRQDLHGYTSSTRTRTRAWSSHFFPCSFCIEFRTGTWDLWTFQIYVSQCWHPSRFM